MRWLGVQLSEKRISDLETLAHYRMLGSGHFQRTGRTPTMVLSTRLSRSETPRRVAPAVPCCACPAASSRS